MNNKFQEGGQISEWNEGDYKNLRLHKAQEIINFASIDPFKKLNFFGTIIFGYKAWFEGINILFREGKAKYSETEFGEVKKLREEIETLLSENEICKEFEERGRRVISINLNNWKEIKKKLNDYEDKVYMYNDSHGLSTRNREEDEGL